MEGEDITTLSTKIDAQEKEIHEIKELLKIVVERLIESNTTTIKGKEKSENMDVVKVHDKGKEEVFSCPSALGVVPISISMVERENEEDDTFNAELFGKTLRDGFQRLYNDSSALESDITLLLEEERIPAHKMLLCAWSETFRSMLGNRAWRESGLGELPIRVEEEDKPHFKNILKYMYTGSTDFINSDNIVPIMAMSDYYGILSLKEICGELLGEQVSEENILYLLDIVDRYDCRILNKKCGEFLASNFLNMLEEEPERLMALRVNTWAAMLSSDELQIRSEDKLFEAMLFYCTQFEGPLKEEALNTLLPCIRFPLLSGKYLIQHVEGNPELQHLPMLHSLLFETYRYRMYPKSGSKATNAKPRQGYQRFDSSECSSLITISEDGCTATLSSGGWHNVRCLVPFSSSYRYIEWKITTGTNFMLGIVDGTCPSTGYAGQYVNGWTYYSQGQLYHSGGTPATGVRYGVGDRIGVLFNPDDEHDTMIKFYKNGVLSMSHSLGSRDSPTYYPIACFSAIGDAVQINPRADIPVDS